MLPARGENIVMNKRICVYCGQMIAGADYHVVGIGQDYANLLACVGCWRERGLVSATAEARETGASRHDSPNLRQAGLWAALPVLAVVFACGGSGVVGGRVQGVAANRRR